jgi:hypothetical protein
VSLVTFLLVLAAFFEAVRGSLLTDVSGEFSYLPVSLVTFLLAFFEAVRGFLLTDLSRASSACVAWRSFSSCWWWSGLGVRMRGSGGERGRERE